MLRNISAQCTLARIREFLRCTKADVGKVTIAIAGERPRTTDGEALDHHFSIRQGRSLFGHVFGRLNGALCSFDCGVVLPGFFDEYLQASWSVLAGGRNSPKNKHTEFVDLRHFSSHTIGDEVTRGHTTAASHFYGDERIRF